MQIQTKRKKLEKFPIGIKAMRIINHAEVGSFKDYIPSWAYGKGWPLTPVSLPAPAIPYSPTPCGRPAAFFYPFAHLTPFVYIDAKI
jgi:hypothetical protein